MCFVTLTVELSRDRVCLSNWSMIWWGCSFVALCFFLSIDLLISLFFPVYTKIVFIIERHAKLCSLYLHLHYNIWIRKSVEIYKCNHVNTRLKTDSSSARWDNLELFPWFQRNVGLTLLTKGGENIWNKGWEGLEVPESFSYRTQCGG